MKMKFILWLFFYLSFYSTKQKRTHTEEENRKQEEEKKKRKRAMVDSFLFCFKHPLNLRLVLLMNWMLEKVMVEYFPHYSLIMLK